MPLTHIICCVGFKLKILFLKKGQTILQATNFKSLAPITKLQSRKYDFDQFFFNFRNQGKQI